MSLFVQLFSLISGTQTHLLLNRIPVNLIDLWFSFHTQDWFFYPSLIWPKCSSNILFLITPLDQTSRIEITWSNCNCNYKMVRTSWLKKWRQIFQQNTLIFSLSTVMKKRGFCWMQSRIEYTTISNIILHVCRYQMWEGIWKLCFSNIYAGYLMHFSVCLTYLTCIEL